MKKLFFILIIFFNFILLPEAAELVFHLPFENEEVKDVIGNRKGEIKGGKFVEGKFGKCMSFGEKDGEGVIFKDIANEKFFQDFEGGPFTISLWIRPLKEYTARQTIINTGGDGEPGWELDYIWRALKFISADKGFTEKGERKYQFVDTKLSKITPDEWNYVAVVKDEKGVLSIYINGRKVASSNEKFNIIPSNKLLSIGVYRGGTAYQFRGFIDEVKIYKGNLTSEEIFKEYQRGYKVDTSSLEVDLKDIEIKNIEREGERIKLELKTGVKNLTTQERKLDVGIYEENIGVLSKKRIKILPDEEKKITFKLEFPDSGKYTLIIDVNEGSKIIYTKSYPVEIPKMPIVLDLLKPIYRNSIYSTQNIDEIKIRMKVKDEEIKGANTEILILDISGKEITKKTSKAEKDSIISLKIPVLKEGEYKIVGKLIKGGKAVAETSIPLYKLPPAKGNEVYIDENLNVIVNGKPIMPIMWWGGTPEEIKETKADGLLIRGTPSNLTKLNQLGLFGECTISIIKNKEYFVESLQEEVIEELPKVINSIKDSPSLLFYYLIDEPETSIISPAVLKDAYEIIKNVDPYHPVLTTISTLNDLDDYIECADGFLPDPYPDPKIDGSFRRPMIYSIPFFEFYKNYGKKFIGLTPQVFNWSTKKDSRYPTFVEERCMNYLGIVYGAKGFNYYVFNTRENFGAKYSPDLRIGIPYLIKEKKSLSEVILVGKDVKEKVKIEDKRIHYSVKDLNGKIYIIAVNVEPVEVNVEIKIPETIEKLKVVSEGREIESKSGIFTDRFYPYEVHIYTDDLKFQDVIDLKKVEEEIKKEGGYYSYKYK